MLRRVVEMSRRNPDKALFSQQLRIFCKPVQLAENREDENSQPPIRAAINRWLPGFAWRCYTPPLRNLEKEHSWLRCGGVGCWFCVC